MDERTRARGRYVESGEARERALQGRHAGKSRAEGAAREEATQPRLTGSRRRAEPVKRLRGGMAVGLVLLTVDRTAGVPRRYREIRELAGRAEDAGFDTVWVPDHLLQRTSARRRWGFWECWTLLSALAATTRRIGLGSLVLCSQLRNPAMLAKMAATLDEVSAGRFVLGLGAGCYPAEWKAFGFPTNAPYERFEEATAIIRSLLDGRTTDFRGNHYRTERCEIWPRRQRNGRVRILVGGNGPRMLRAAARFADASNLGYATSPRALGPSLERLSEACAAVRRRARTLAATAIVPVGFPDLGPLPEWFSDYLTGTPRTIAATLRAFADVGLSEVMLHCEPDSPRALERLRRAVELFRDPSRRGA